MSTASRVAASASSRRPSVAQMTPRLLSDPARSGREGVGPLGGEASVDVGRLLGRRERVLAPAEVAQTIAEIVQRSRVKHWTGPMVGAGVRLGRREFAQGIDNPCR